MYALVMQLTLADVHDLGIAVSSIESVSTRIQKRQVTKGERGRIAGKIIKNFCRRKTE